MELHLITWLPIASVVYCSKSIVLRFRVAGLTAKVRVAWFFEGAFTMLFRETEMGPTYTHTEDVFRLPFKQLKLV